MKTVRTTAVLGVPTAFCGPAHGLRHIANTRQALEFTRVAKMLAGVLDLKRVRNDAFRLAGEGMLSFWRMLEVPDAQCAEGVHCYIPAIISSGCYSTTTGIWTAATHYLCQQKLQVCRRAIGREIQYIECVHCNSDPPKNENP